MHVRDWLTIQREKTKDSRLQEFIQANPILNMRMTSFLVKLLNLTEPQFQNWMHNYLQALECNYATSECNKRVEIGHISKTSSSL